MAYTPLAKKVWRARDVTLAIMDASSLTLATTGTLESFFVTASTSFHAIAKNVTIVEPEGSAEILQTLGEDANSIPNAALEQKRFGLAEISGTLLHVGKEGLETYAFKNGSVAISGSYTRYQVNKGSRNEVAMLVHLDDGTDEVNICLDNAIVTKLGERKISDADGHWEQEFRAVCLPVDFYLEFKD